MGEPEPAAAGEEPAGRPPVSGVRVGVGLLLGAVVVLVVILDALLGRGQAFAAAAPGTGLLLAALSAAALLEVYALLERVGVLSHARYGATASLVLLSARAWLPVAGVRPRDAALLGDLGLLLAVLAPLAVAVATRPGKDRPEADPDVVRRCAGTALGLLFVHLPIAMLLELRLAPPLDGVSDLAPTGLVLVFLVALSCKVGDSAAYFAGRTIGRHPLCWVSPKKTWEGAVAGAAAGAAAGGLFGASLGVPFRHALAMALLVNLAGQGGDLLESLLKRACGAKDSGRTFGEMGGALDLIDALLLAGPVGYGFHRIVLA